MESITLSDQAMSNCLCFIFFLTNTTAYSVSKILNYSVLPPSPSGHYPIVPSKTVLLPKFQQSLPFAKPSVSLPLSKPPFGLRKHCTALGRCKHTTPLLSMYLPQKRHASGLGFQAPQTSTIMKNTFIHFRIRCWVSFFSAVYSHSVGGILILHEMESNHPSH